VSSRHHGICVLVRDIARDQSQRRLSDYSLCGHGLTFSSLNSYAFSVDPVLANPAVDSPTVVPNLEAFPLNSLDQMQVLGSVHLAQDDVADVHILYVGWDHRAKLAGFDLA
jgi:hypothetical protein